MALFKCMPGANIESLSCKIGRAAITNSPEKRLHATMEINYASRLLNPCAERGYKPCILQNIGIKMFRLEIVGTFRFINFVHLYGSAIDRSTNNVRENVNYPF